MPANLRRILGPAAYRRPPVVNLAGIMIGLPGVAAVSLFLLRRRVRTRGRLEPAASMLTRSAFPIVLGLAGWFLGVLIVTITMPSVPLDSRLLATISVSIPVALGISLAWMHRDWSARTKTRGLLAAATGSLCSAWLGSYVIEGPLALLSTILAAMLGANLLLLIIDVVGTRSRPREVTTTPPRRAAEARVDDRIPRDSGAKR